eukprot:GHVS01085064.1.p1 GENE.GHVS01085064.1~~GHVS01085064.1.p1  ORF type:complete len:496 (+),score=90.83 GHVS01085064.1:367-1854(+)
MTSPTLLFSLFFFFSFILCCFFLRCSPCEGYAPKRPLSSSSSSSSTFSSSGLLPPHSSSSYFRSPPPLPSSSVSTSYPRLVSSGICGFVQTAVRPCSASLPVSSSSSRYATSRGVPLQRFSPSTSSHFPLLSLSAVPAPSSFSNTSPEALNQAAQKVLGILTSYKKKGKVSDTYIDIFAGFVGDYARETAKSGQMSADEFIELTTSLMKIAETTTEFPFSAYHQAVRKPFDFYDWGNRFWRHLIDMPNSRLLGKDSLQRISDQLDKGDNVVLLSNHQIEPDPQVMRLAFQQMGFGALGEQLVMVAGHRVRTDPLSIPFSMGCNLLCVHSKKHMDAEPRLRETHQQENMHTMLAMESLLAQGGKLIWVAPSGGRDRAAAGDGPDQFTMAEFDPKTVQMFRLMAKKSGRTTHFFPMALWTAAICPPPPKVEESLGESRTCAYSPVGVAVGSELSGMVTLKAAEFSAIAQKQSESLYDRIRQRKPKEAEEQEKMNLKS